MFQEKISCVLGMCFIALQIHSVLFSALLAALRA